MKIDFDDILFQMVKVFFCFEFECETVIIRSLYKEKIRTDDD
jgi:hypothetical protein